MFLDANICVLASYCYFNYSLFAIYECKAVHKPCMLEFVYGKCLRFDTLPLVCTKTGVKISSGKEKQLNCRLHLVVVLGKKCWISFHTTPHA